MERHSASPLIPPPRFHRPLLPTANTYSSPHPYKIRHRAPYSRPRPWRNSIKCRLVADARSKYWEHPPRWFASINPERHSYTKIVRASRMNGVNIIPHPLPGIYGCTIRKQENIPIWLTMREKTGTPYLPRMDRRFTFWANATEGLSMYIHSLSTPHNL